MRFRPRPAPPPADDLPHDGVAPYELAGELTSGPNGSGRGRAVHAGEASFVNDPSNPWREVPAKRVQTTLGRTRPAAEETRADANARVVRALHPGAALPWSPQAPVASLEPAPAPRLRRESFVRLRPLVGREPLGRRLLMTTTAFLFAAVYLAMLLTLWAPAHNGVDQNGYLVGGKLIARTGSMAYVPPDDYSFVGNMWVATSRLETEGIAEYFPKYPAGLPALYAAFFRVIPDEARAAELAHLVSPVSTTLAVLGMFFLGRFAGGSFLGVLAMVALAASQPVLRLANNPNSHAAALVFVVWGFVFLLWWWRSGRLIPGVLAGLLLGYAFTIRYTEGLLGLPLGLACVFAWQWRRPVVSTLRVLPPLIAWAVPVAGLFAYNRWTMAKATGYDSTGEAAGFGWEYVTRNWLNMAQQMNDGGLYFLMPLGVVGVLAMTVRRLRLGIVLLAWLVPTLFVYTAYYWAPTAERSSTAYLRFFVTVFPVLLMGATYLLWRVLHAPAAPGDAPLAGPLAREGRAARLWRQTTTPVAAGLVVAAAVGVGAHRAVGYLPGGNDRGSDVGIQASFQNQLNSAARGRVVRDTVPPDAVLFVDSPGGISNFLHHLQYTGDWSLFDASVFTDAFARRVSGAWNRAGEEGNPNPLQRRRYNFLRDLYDGKSGDDLSSEVRRIVQAAFDENRPVYFAGPEGTDRRFARSHFDGRFRLETVASFHDVGLVRPDGRAPRRQTQSTRRLGNAAADIMNVAGSWTIYRVVPRDTSPSTRPTTAPA